MDVDIRENDGEVPKVGICECDGEVPKEGLLDVKVEGKVDPGRRLEPKGHHLGAQVRGLVLELAGVDSVGILAGAGKHCDNVHVLT